MTIKTANMGLLIEAEVLGLVFYSCWVNYVYLLENYGCFANALILLMISLIR